MKIIELIEIFLLNCSTNRANPFFQFRGLFESLFIVFFLNTKNHPHQELLQFHLRTHSHPTSLTFGDVCISILIK